MPQINVDKDPGWYGGAIDVTVTFGPNSRKAIITEDDRVPVLSEVLAYDRGPLATEDVPPGDPNTPGYVDRPFLAVTQDGRGNVFYDGGFPKFYNQSLMVGGAWPATPPTTFAALTAASKYLHNALNFVANKTEVAKGNRKILFVGNEVVSGSYPIKGSHYNPPGGQGGENGIYGFRDTFSAVAAVAGYVPTFYDRSDSPTGKLDLTFAYLSQFVAVIFLGSANTDKGTTYVTKQFSDELAYYRTQGYGVGIITDHNGAFFTDLQTAVTNSSVFCYDPNQIAQHFGTYFSGNVYRAPKNVGEIRAGLGGDHPLLANLSDSEFIFAGGSESLVMVETFAGNQVPVNQPKTYHLSTPGTHRINVLVQDNDGAVQVRPYRYDIIDPSNLLFQDARARTIGTTLTTLKKSFDLSLFYNVATPPTMSGYILRNNVRMGTFHLANNVMSTKFCSGGSGGFEYLPTDIVGYQIKDPFIYKVETTIQAFDRTELEKQWTQPSQIGKLLAATPDYSGIRSTEALRMFWQFANVQYRDVAGDPGNVFGIWPRVLSRVKRALSGSLSMCNNWVALTPADWAANKPTNPAEGDTAVVASTGMVYSWWITDGTGTWTASEETAAKFYTAGRLLRDIRTGDIYRIDATKLTKQ